MAFDHEHVLVVHVGNCATVGKSYFVKTPLENANCLLSVMPENIVWCYNCWQPLHQELLHKYPFIKFLEDLTESLSTNHLFPSNKISITVIDEFMNSTCESNEF